MYIRVWDEGAFMSTLDSGMYEDLIRHVGFWAEEGYLIHPSKVPDGVDYEQAKRAVAIGVITREGHQIWQADKSNYYDSYHKIIARIEEKRANGQFKLKQYHPSPSSKAYTPEEWEEIGKRNQEERKKKRIVKLVAVSLLIAIFTAIAIVFSANSALIVANQSLAQDLVNDLSKPFPNQWISTPNGCLQLFNAITFVFALIIALIPYDDVEIDTFWGKVCIGVCIVGAILAIALGMMLFAAGAGWIALPISAAVILFVCGGITAS